MFWNFIVVDLLSSFFFLLFFEFMTTILTISLKYYYF